MKNGTTADVLDVEIEKHLEQIKNILNNKKEGNITKFVVIVLVE